MICVAATTLLSLAAPAPTNRRELSFEVIAGFLPSTDVCDENQLDLDQYNFKMAMFSGSAYAEAEAIYKQGLAAPARTFAAPARATARASPAPLARLSLPRCAWPPPAAPLCAPRAAPASC